MIQRAFVGFLTEYIVIYLVNIKVIISTSLVLLNYKTLQKLVPTSRCTTVMHVIIHLNQTWCVCLWKSSQLKRETYWLCHEGAEGWLTQVITKQFHSGRWIWFAKFSDDYFLNEETCAQDNYVFPPVCIQQQAAYQLQLHNKKNMIRPVGVNCACADRHCYTTITNVRKCWGMLERVVFCRKGLSCEWVLWPLELWSVF